MLKNIKGLRVLGKSEQKNIIAGNDILGLVVSSCEFQASLQAAAFLNDNNETTQTTEGSIMFTIMYEEFYNNCCCGG